MNEETFDDIFDWLNKSERQFTEKLAERVQGAHHTLQQCFVRSILAVLRTYAKNTYTDARNRDSVALCDKIAELTDGVVLPFI